MLIIFGLKSSVRPFGVVTITCRRCGNPAAHRLEERRRTITLFFVPVIPLGRRTVLTCTYCGLISDVEAAQMPALLAQAHDLILPTRPPSTRRPDNLPGWQNPDHP